MQLESAREWLKRNVSRRAWIFIGIVSAIGVVDLAAVGINPVFDLLAIVVVLLAIVLPPFLALFLIYKARKSLWPRLMRWQQVGECESQAKQKYALVYAVTMQVCFVVGGLLSFGDLLKIHQYWNAFFPCPLLVGSAYLFHKWQTHREFAFYYIRSWLPVPVSTLESNYYPLPPDRVELGLDPPPFRRLFIHILVIVFVFGYLLSLNSYNDSSLLELTVVLGIGTGTLWAVGIQRHRTYDPLQFLPAPPNSA